MNGYKYLIPGVREVELGMIGDKVSVVAVKGECKAKDFRNFREILKEEGVDYI